MQTPEGPWPVAIKGQEIFVNGIVAKAIIRGHDLTSPMLSLRQDFAITEYDDGTCAGFIVTTNDGFKKVAGHYSDYPSYAAALLDGASFAVNNR
jgi:hypothetical protein